MGGDHGPDVVVPAAIQALNKYPKLCLILVGNSEQLNKARQQHNFQADNRLIIKHADQVVAMDEAPASAMRTKKDSSMRVALNLVKEGTAAACVSAGNTGALMATARYVLKMLPGIDRPAIVRSLPCKNGSVLVLDLGANVDCLAEHLLQFAIMGSNLAKNSQRENPRVGLLNVGAESIKGSEVVKQTDKLLSEQIGINYIGFVEGNDIFMGNVDVVVCDGFVGNVLLKTSEGLAKLIMHFAREEFTRSWYTKLLALIAKPVLRSLKNRFNPDNYNGASLLGLQGVVIKSHGGASVAAFGQAISVAMDAV